MNDIHRTVFRYARFIRLASTIVSSWVCGSFVVVDCLGSSRRIVVMCEMELAKILREELTAAQRIDEGESKAHLYAILLWDQCFRLPSPNELALGSMSIPHRSMCLLLVHKCRYVTILFVFRCFRCHEAVFYTFLLFMMPLGFQGDFASCSRNSVVLCQFRLY